jgi:DNA-binding HxlR family transcriptional regulator
MTEHSRLPSDPQIAERTIVLQLLRDDHDERWPRTELEAELDNVEPLTLSDAIAGLERHGVVVVQGEHVVASPCARHLDELGLIAI